MSWILAKFEGLLLAAWGLVIFWFARYGDYWMLLNPKFKWLTITGSVLVFIFGITLLIFAKKMVNYRRIAVFTALTFLAPNVLFKAFDSTALVTSTVSNVTSFFHGFKDEKYPRRSLTELFMSVGDPGQTPILTPFQTIGVVKRLPELDREGEFVVLETFVFCCLADAVALGIRVPCDGVSNLKDGDWVKISGVLEKRPTPKTTPPFRMGPVNMSVVNPDYFIRADQVLPTDPPEIPFYFKNN